VEFDDQSRHAARHPRRQREGRLTAGVQPGSRRGAGGREPDFRRVRHRRRRCGNDLRGRRRPASAAEVREGAIRRIVMRLLVVMILFASGTASLAAAPADLLAAIRNGDHSQVRKLIEAGADVDTADHDGTTAPMPPGIESDRGMMKLPIDKGAGVNMKNSLDSTALMYAATSLAKTRLLLDADAEVRVKGRRGATPISVALATFGSTPVLRLLVNKGAELEDRLMTLAAGTGDLEAIQYLLSVGVPPGDRTGAALSAAITARCEACARLLVERGAPANALRPNGTLNTNVGASSGGVLNDTAK